MSLKRVYENEEDEDYLPDLDIDDPITSKKFKPKSENCSIKENLTDNVSSFRSDKPTSKERAIDIKGQLNSRMLYEKNHINKNCKNIETSLKSQNVDCSNSRFKNLNKGMLDWKSFSELNKPAQMSMNKNIDMRSCTKNLNQEKLQHLKTHNNRVNVLQKFNNMDLLVNEKKNNVQQTGLVSYQNRSKDIVNKPIKNNKPQVSHNPQLKLSCTGNLKETKLLNPKKNKDVNVFQKFNNVGPLIKENKPHDKPTGLVTHQNNSKDIVSKSIKNNKPQVSHNPRLKISCTENLSQKFNNMGQFVKQNKPKVKQAGVVSQQNSTEGIVNKYIKNKPQVSLSHKSQLMVNTNKPTTIVVGSKMKSNFDFKDRKAPYSKISSKNSGTEPKILASKLCNISKDPNKQKLLNEVGKPLLDKLKLNENTFSQAFTGDTNVNEIVYVGTSNVKPNCVENISNSKLDYKNKTNLPKIEESELQLTSDSNKQNDLMTDKLKIKEFFLHFMKELYATNVVNSKLAKLMTCQQHYFDFNDVGNKNVQTCPYCYWPLCMKLAFTSKIVQNIMIERILKRISNSFKTKKVQYYSIAEYIIHFFPMDLQLKIREVLADCVSPSQGNQNEEEDDFGIAETFSEYKPTKLLLGHNHPDSVVETASLSSVEPPDITYELSIPTEVIQNKKLSSLQLETIVYACQRHEQILSNGKRAGFLVGDGAGVGKGRTIAGVIFENFLKGRRKAVWISVSNDLKFDAERDLKDIGATNITVHSLSKLSYGKSNNIGEGVLFSTYASLIGQSKCKSKNMFKSRLDQVVHWFGRNFDGCIVFDECHKAKNLIGCGGRKPTKTGQAVERLQSLLPKARIFYSSATGASEPKNMAYMNRLGIWGSGGVFEDFPHFRKSVNQRGVGVMEMIALDLKRDGAYMARQLSFHEVSFRIEEVNLTAKYIEMYDKSCELWTKTFTYYQELIGFIENPVERKTMMGFYWASHQRFFKYLCIGVKIDHTVGLCKAALEDGKCVVIGLQMTGEASTEKILNNEGHIQEFVSAAKCVLESVITRYSVKDINDLKIRIQPGGNNSETDKTVTVRGASTLLKTRASLIFKLRALESSLPTNALDDLINKLGGVEKVAEMTGRKGRVVKQTNGNIGYELRRNEGEVMELVNMCEKEKFMDGRKEIAIISDASSTGVSLQSDLRVTNQKRRVHITLELPWSADKAIQQFGRTHRSNQANAPEYILIISALGGERRFASAVAKRLESLGALTHGDRRVMEARDLSSFNIESKYGTLALKRIMEEIFDPDSTLLEMQEALLKVQIFQDENKVKYFLNRLLGIPILIQNNLFKRFSNTHDDLIRRDKQSGDYDGGTLDLGIGGQSCKSTDEIKWKLKHQTGEVETTLYTVSVERGISWTDALNKYNKLRKNRYDGFYVSKNKTFRKRTICLALLKTSGSKKFEQYTIFKPNIGQGKPLTFDELAKNYKRVIDVSSDNVKNTWNDLYEHTRTKCQHTYGGGFCSVDGQCSFGLRTCIHYILCGFIMKVWTELEKLFSKASIYYRTIRIMRLMTFDGKRLVGVRIPSSMVDSLKEKFNDLSDPSKQNQIENDVEDSILDKPLELRKASLPKKISREKTPFGTFINSLYPNIYPKSPNDDTENDVLDQEQDDTNDPTDSDCSLASEVCRLPKTNTLATSIDEMQDTTNPLEETFVSPATTWARNNVLNDELYDDGVFQENLHSYLCSDDDDKSIHLPDDDIEMQSTVQSKEDVDRSLPSPSTSIQDDENFEDLEDKKCIKKVQGHFKEFKINENYSVRIEILHNNRNIKVENRQIKPEIMEIDLESNIKVRLESIVSETKTGIIQSTDEEQRNGNQENFESFERANNNNTLQNSQCDIDVKPNIFLNNIASEDSKHRSQFINNIKREEFSLSDNCSNNTTKEQDSNDTTKQDFDDTTKQDFDDTTKQDSNNITKVQDSDDTTKVQVSDNTTKEHSSNDTTKEQDSKNTTEQDVDDTTKQDSNDTTKEQNSSKLYDALSTPILRENDGNNIGSSRISEIRKIMTRSSSRRKISDDDKVLNEFQSTTGEPVLDFNLGTDSSNNTTKEQNSSTLTSASSTPIPRENDEYNIASSSSEIKKIMTRSSSRGKKSDDDDLNEVQPRTNDPILDYEDIDCIIDTRCNLNEIKNLLGIEGPSVQSDDQETDNWKDVLKNLKSEVTSLQEFIKLQFGMKLSS